MLSPIKDNVLGLDINPQTGTTRPSFMYAGKSGLQRLQNDKEELNRLRNQKIRNETIRDQQEVVEEAEKEAMMQTKMAQQEKGKEFLDSFLNDMIGGGLLF